MQNYYFCSKEDRKTYMTCKQTFWAVNYSFNASYARNRHIEPLAKRISESFTGLHHSSVQQGEIDFIKCLIKRISRIYKLKGFYTLSCIWLLITKQHKEDRSKNPAKVMIHAKSIKSITTSNLPCPPCLKFQLEQR